MATKPCPQCQTSLDEDDDFCGKCGAVLDPSLLAEEDEFSPPTEPSFERLPPPLDDAAPTFDGLLEELTGTIDVFAAAHVIFAGVDAQPRVDVGKLTRLSAVLGIRPGVNVAAAQLTPYERHVLSLINGNRSVARVGKKSGLDPQDVKRAIGALAERGLVELKGELKADLRALLLDVGDDTGETTLPTFESPPRTTPGVVLLGGGVGVEGLAADLAGELGDDDDAPPPMDDAPQVASDATARAPSVPHFAERTRVVITATRAELGPLWQSSLSQGWLFVATDSPPPAYTAITIDLDTPDGSMLLTGDVVHVQLPGGGGPAGAGLQLTGLTKEVRDRIDGYVKGQGPLGEKKARAPAADASRLEGALGAARVLSNGNEAGDVFAALGLVTGCARDVVEQRVEELTRLFAGPHQTATPPQAARCENALKLLRNIASRAVAEALAPAGGVTYAAVPAPAETPTREPIPEARPAPTPPPSDAYAFSSFSSSSASVVAMPGMPGAPKPQPAAKAAAPHAPPRPAPAPAPAPPVNNAQRMRAMQLLETAVKELRAGKRSSALTYIRMAAEIAPDDPQVKSLLAAWTGKA